MFTKTGDQEYTRYATNRMELSGRVVEVEPVFYGGLDEMRNRCASLKPGKEIGQPRLLPHTLQNQTQREGENRAQTKTKYNPKPQTVTIPREFNSKCMLNPATSRLSLQYNNITNHVYFLGAEGTSITFKGKLAEILGFNPGEAFTIPQTPSFRKHYAAPHPADIHGGCYNICVH